MPEEKEIDENRVSKIVLGNSSKLTFFSSVLIPLLTPSEKMNANHSTRSFINQSLL